MTILSISKGSFLAKIDLARRAVIGRDRRAKTREQIMSAARALYSEFAFEIVTVDDVVRKAEVARGTFYVHYKDIEELRRAVADELAADLERMRRPERTLERDPLERIAGGCFAFIQQASLNPAWGSLVARAAWALPIVGRAARENLAEDLRQAVSQKRIPAISPDLGIAIVTGIVLQTMRSVSEKRLLQSDLPVAIVAVLLSLGVSRREATAAAQRVVDGFNTAPKSKDTRRRTERYRRG